MREEKESKGKINKVRREESYSLKIDEIAKAKGKEAFSKVIADETDYKFRYTYKQTFCRLDE